MWSEKHTHNTRFSSSGALALPKLNSESGKKMFNYNSITLWNRLPTQVRNIENYMQIKQKCKCIIIVVYLYWVYIF